MSACPACGYELLPHRSRVRCKRCGKRIPSDSVECPRCGADPRAGRVPPIVPRVLAVVVGLLLIACIGWIVFRAITTNVLGRVIAPGEPSRVPTQFVQVIYIVATPMLPTLTPTPVASPTVRVTPSPTKRGARPVPTTVPITPASVGSYPAVPLIAPANMTVYSGAKAVIILEWQSVVPNGLRENEWYEIKVTFAARDGRPGERKSYSKELRWTVSSDLYRELSPDARTFNWNVNVVRVEGIDPLSSPNRTYISPPGVARAFIWN